MFCVKLWFRVLGSRLNRVLGSSLSRERAGWDLLHRGLGLGLGRGLLPHRLACRLGRLVNTLSLPMAQSVDLTLEHVELVFHGSHLCQDHVKLGVELLQDDGELGVSQDDVLLAHGRRSVGCLF